MNFEIAPDNYWIQCTYHDIKLYLFLLGSTGKNHWRLPRYEEIAPLSRHIGEIWVQEDVGVPSAFFHADIQLLIPVRDVDDEI